MYWTLGSWGADYPPENADEIISRANALINAYSADHDDAETENYSAKLWDSYSATGALPEI